MLKGNVVLVAMAAVWCDLGFLLTQTPWTWCVVPPLISVALFAAARRVFAHVPPRSAEEERRIGRLVGLWSAAEGIGFAVAALTLANTGLAALIPASLAVIVGLHFLPLAHGTPNRLYYVTGTAMISAGVADSIAPDKLGLRAMTVACGVILWGTALGIMKAARQRQ